jgi:hypothetical protein
VLPKYVSYLCMEMWNSSLITFDTIVCNLSLFFFSLWIFNFLQLRFLSEAFSHAKFTSEVEFFGSAAPDLDQSSIYGAWKIDDTENSFSTQTFRIKYARQDVHLCMMISFDLSRSSSLVMISLSLSSLSTSIKGKET